MYNAIAMVDSLLKSFREVVYLYDCWQFVLVFRYDLIMIGSFTATFSCWLWSYLTIEEEDYDMERKFWNPYDPTLIGEGLMAFSTVLAFGRILYILQVHHNLGPLLVLFMGLYPSLYLNIKQYRNFNNIVIIDNYLEQSWFLWASWISAKFFLLVAK